MAKKKKRYPNRKRNIIIGSIITAAVIILAVAGIATSVYLDMRSKNYVATINGEKVGVSEFKMELLQQQLMFENNYQITQETWYQELDTDYLTVDYAKDMAYSYLMSGKVEVFKARELGVAVLSDEQKANVEADMESIKMYYGAEIMKYIGISDKDLFEALSVAYISDNLYNKVTSEGYVLDEEAFEEEYAAYIEENREGLRTYDINYIVVNSRELMDEILAQLDEGADFRDLVVEHSLDYYVPEPEPTEDGEEAEEEPDETDYALFSYVGNTMPEIMSNAVYVLEIGHVSEVLEYYNQEYDETNYILVKLLSVTEPDYDTVKSGYKDSYVKSQKDDYYSVQFQEWQSEYDIVRNYKGTNAVKLYGH